MRPLSYKYNPSRTVELFKDRKGEWRWRMVSKGRIIATSGEGYKRKASLLKTLYGIEMCMWLIVDTTTGSK